MSVRIRLTRTGRKNLPSYRIAVFDSRTRRDGPALEVLGWFNPLTREAGKGFKVASDRLEHWLRQGARLTLAVTQLLHRQGLKVPAPAAAPAKPKAKKAAAKPAAGKAGKVPDKRSTEQRKRKLARRASRRALAAKRAAAAKAPAGAAKAAPAKE